jgi:hypothetical protein
MSSKEDALIEELHRRAQETTGLHDWGRDNSYRDGLTALVSDVVNLPDRVQEVAQDQIVGLLSTRLQLERDAAAEPGMLDQEIGMPLVVIGLPRTGTSLLFELLQLDPESRCPMVWEASYPSPPPDVHNYKNDPRIALSEAQAPNPEVQALHPSGPETPAECHAITMLHFDSAYFVAFMEIPHYREWMLSHREFTLFRTHRRLLQQLQWRGPRGRWTLKSPQHPLNLESLIEAYPGAMLIQTHRDPLTSMSSLASLIRATRRPLYPDSDPHKLGAEIIDTWTTVLERGIAAREDRAVDAAIFDVDYRDLVANPLRSVEQIYEHFGLPMGLPHRERIREFLAAGAGTGHGSHQYSPDEFGIRRPELLARMPNYADRFASLVTVG